MAHTCLHHTQQLSNSSPEPWCRLGWYKCSHTSFLCFLIPDPVDADRRCCWNSSHTKPWTTNTSGKQKKRQLYRSLHAWLLLFFFFLPSSPSESQLNHGTDREQLPRKTHLEERPTRLNPPRSHPATERIWGQQVIQRCVQATRIEV